MRVALVSGALANKPGYGGEAWVRTTWLTALARLGFATCFVEQIESAACVDELGGAVPFERSYNRRFFEEALAATAPGARACLILDEGATTAGLPYGEVADLAAEAEVLVNISGHLQLDPLKRAPRRRAYLDVDPGFTQIWAAAGSAAARLDGHHAYFTVGQNLGSTECSIPSAGIEWQPLPPPVCLDQWPPGGHPPRRAFTTVAAWRSPLGELTHDGVSFRGKHHEWRRLVELPRRSQHEFEIALDIHPADERDRESLRDHGWNIVDPRQAAGDPAAFRSYVQGSAAECSVAHGVYVQTRSGWLSDRTVRYLASGRPALVQDTGLSARYPVGEGLVTFQALDEAVAGAESIMSDYARHAQAARALAVERFDAEPVARALLERLGVE